MMCPSCGYDNLPGELVCTKCGYPLPANTEDDDWGVTPLEPDPFQPKASRVRRVGFWIEVVLLGLFLGLLGWVGYLWWRQPEQLNQYVDVVLGKGKQVVQSVGDLDPGQWINGILGREPAPTPVPEPPTATPAPTSAPTVTPTPEPPPTDTPAAEATATPEPSPTPEPVIPYIEIAEESLVNLREGPGTDFEVVGALQSGDRADVTGMLENGEWCRIDFDGEPAWIACYLDVVELFHTDEVPIVTE